MNKLKRLCAFILMINIAMITAGCNGDKTADRTISYEVAAYPVNIDPQLAAGETDLLIVRNIFEGLFRLDKNGEPVEGAVSGYTVSEDGLTYTFHLSDQAVWQDDTPLTAEDFVFGFRRGVDPVTKAPSAELLANIKGAAEIISGKKSTDTLAVTAEGEHTLKIELMKKDPDFPMILTTAICMPCNKDFFDKSSGTYGLTQNTILANGSFTLKRWQEKTSIRLNRNTSYVGSFTAKPGAVLLSVPEKSGNTNSSTESNTATPKALWERIKEGTVDAGKLDTTAIAAAESAGLTLTSIEDTCWAAVINPQAAVGNVHIQKALRNSMHRNVYEAELPNGFTLANSLIPADTTIHGASHRSLITKDYSFPYDPVAAQKNFADEVKKLPGKKLPDTALIYADEPGMKEAASLIAAQWQQNLGLYLNIEGMSRDKLLSSVAAGKYQIALYPVSSADFTSVSLLKQFLSGSPSNVFGYKDTRFDTALSQVDTAAESAVLASQLSSAEDILLSYNGITPVFYTASVYAASPLLQDMTVFVSKGPIDFSSVGKTD